MESFFHHPLPVAKRPCNAPLYLAEKDLAVTEDLTHPTN